MTLREVDIIQKGVGSRLRREHDERAWMVWHIAALPKAKKMPDLKSLQSKGGQARQPKQHWKAMEAIVAQWG